MRPSGASREKTDQALPSTEQNAEPAAQVPFHCQVPTEQVPSESFLAGPHYTQLPSFLMKEMRADVVWYLGGVGASVYADRYLNKYTATRYMYGTQQSKSMNPGVGEGSRHVLRHV